MREILQRIGGVWVIGEDHRENASLFPWFRLGHPVNLVAEVGTLKRDALLPSVK